VSSLCVHAGQCRRHYKHAESATDNRQTMQQMCRAIGEADTWAEYVGLRFVRSAMIRAWECEPPSNAELTHRYLRYRVRRIISFRRCSHVVYCCRIKAVYCTSKLFTKRRIVVETQTKIQRQAIFHPPVVLDEASIIVGSKISPCCLIIRTSRWKAQKKRGQICAKRNMRT